MAAKHSRASTLQQRRLIQMGTAVASVAFVGMALGAVVLDRSVTPAEKPSVDPVAPSSAGQGDQGDTFKPMPKLIATGLSSVYELEADKTPIPSAEGEKRPTPPPQDVVLVAAIGQPGSMMAVIREGASQTALAEGQRAGSVEVLEVRPSWARVRHSGQEKELTVGEPMLMVSDMGAGGGSSMGGRAITQPGSDALVETMEERGVTRTGSPTSFQRATSGGNNPPGTGSTGGRRGGGNQGNQGGNQGGNGGGRGGGSENQVNGNGQPVPGGPKQEDDR